MKKGPEPPKRFKFGPYHWTVKLVAAPGKSRTEEGHPKLEGQTDLVACVVELDKALTPYRMATTLHHEIGHVIRFVFGGTEVEDAEKQEEHNVNLYSTGYIMVEQDNPALCDYFNYWLRNKR